MLYFILSIAVLALDILTKSWASKKIIINGSVPIIKNVFHLTYVENTGVAFGMLQDKRVIFITISLVILAVLGIYFYKTKNKNVWLKLGVALIYSGSIGNLIERIGKGYVVDFLDFCLINFPVFNIADIAVCIGAAMLVIHLLFFSEKTDDMENEE